MKTLVERELKLGPPPGLDLAALGGEPLPVRQFESTYYDTAGRTLLRRGVTLRRRVEGDVGRWQLKLPNGEARLELEFDEPDETPPQRVQSLLLALTRRWPLEPVATLRTTRNVRRLVRDGAVLAELSLDAVAVVEAGQVVAAFDELEAELVEGTEDDLRAIEQQLREAGATDAPGSTKLARALALDPERTERDESQLAAALREQLQAILDHDAGTRVGVDPEDLHKHRVATRRLRAFVRTARPLLDPEWAEATQTELRWLGGALGGVRDLDVLIGHVRDEAATLDAGDREALEPVVSSLEHERDAARAAMLDALESDRYLALLERLEAGPPPAAAKPKLRTLWQREHARAQRAVQELGAEPADDELHGVRIRVKRARYAAELAGGAEKYVDAAKELQDVLGAHQDAVVVEEALRRHVGEDGRAGIAAGRIVERERARRVEARAAWQSAWKLLDRRA